ncbi:hypothetical protein A4G26_15605 [Mycobacterium kansasii]|uniref:Uncharacterized protein n=1 Tax=Mycobacterium innocens TaxID=2341083 RepID=A0A498Q1F3_9MYCO|nr:hypothetical protein [Mycobacterium innocens]KZS57549.1 hypothetical protein A4G26_15605 [Mycobacterium kansasii]VBA39706.1 hypothetical protein LAUMK13_02724 [Mycobacterium innocens]
MEFTYFTGDQCTDQQYQAAAVVAAAGSSAYATISVMSVIGRFKYLGRHIVEVRFVARRDNAVDKPCTLGGEQLPELRQSAIPAR